MGGELARGKLARGVGAALPDEAGLGAERGSPGGDVRGLPAGADARRRAARSSPASERAVEADDHVEDQVAEGDEAHA